MELCDRSYEYIRLPWSGVDEGFVRIYRQQHLFGHTHNQSPQRSPAPTGPISAGESGEPSMENTTASMGSAATGMNDTIGA